MAWAQMKLYIMGYMKTALHTWSFRYGRNHDLLCKQKNCKVQEERSNNWVTVRKSEPKFNGKVADKKGTREGKKKWENKTEGEKEKVQN